MKIAALKTLTASDNGYFLTYGDALSKRLFGFGNSDNFYSFICKLSQSCPLASAYVCLIRNG